MASPESQIQEHEAHDLLEGGTATSDLGVDGSRATGKVGKERQFLQQEVTTERGQEAGQCKVQVTSAIPEMLEQRSRRGLAKADWRLSLQGPEAGLRHPLGKNPHDSLCPSRPRRAKTGEQGVARGQAAPCGPGTAAGEPHTDCSPEGGGCFDSRTSFSWV